jgi:hypothetical protein
LAFKFDWQSLAQIRRKSFNGTARKFPVCLGVGTESVSKDKRADGETADEQND